MSRGVVGEGFVNSGIDQEQKFLSLLNLKFSTPWNNTEEGILK
jgi:hypothetical protein